MQRLVTTFLTDTKRGRKTPALACDVLLLHGALVLVWMSTTSTTTGRRAAEALTTWLLLPRLAEPARGRQRNAHRLVQPSRQIADLRQRVLDSLFQLVALFVEVDVDDGFLSKNNMSSSKEQATKDKLFHPKCLKG